MKTATEIRSDPLPLLYAGIRKQQDRDARAARRATAERLQDWRMIRVRIPAGTLTAAQYLALDEIGDRCTYNRSLRVTTGQSIQFHGVAPEDIDQLKSDLRNAGLAAGCHPTGFEFAVAVSPVPSDNPSYHRLRQLAAEICDEFYPRPAHESGANPAHPPRKFTVGLALPEDNSANIFANDAAFLLVETSGGERRLNVYAGGSLSMPARRPETYARLASPLGSIRPEDAIAVVHSLTAVFTDYGQIETRRFTRLKYVIDSLGLERFRRELEKKLGFAFSETVAHEPLKIPTWSGPHDQGKGEFYYGLLVPYGRIMDQGLLRYKTAIRTIVEHLRPRVILAPDQNLVFAGLRIEQIARLEQILTAYHIPFGDEITSLRFSAMACAGLPTCPMALAESERIAPQILNELEAELIRIGRAGAPFHFRISGCSIGCIRPNMVDLGAIGRKPGHYDLFVGGSESEGRFAELYAENVPLKEIVPTLRPLLEIWSNEGGSDETFAEFYTRRFAAVERADHLALSVAIPARDRVREECHRTRRTCACLA